MQTLKLKSVAHGDTVEITVHRDGKQPFKTVVQLTDQPQPIIEVVCKEID